MSLGRRNKGCTPPEMPYQGLRGSAPTTHQNQQPPQKQGLPGVVLLVLLVIAVGIVYAFTKGLF